MRDQYYQFILSRTRFFKLSEKAKQIALNVLAMAPELPQEEIDRLLKSMEAPHAKNTQLLQAIVRVINQRFPERKPFKVEAWSADLPTTITHVFKASEGAFGIVLSTTYHKAMFQLLSCFIILNKHYSELSEVEMDEVTTLALNAYKTLHGHNTYLQRDEFEKYVYRFLPCINSAAAFNESFTIFILCHELAHILMGHTDTEPKIDPAPFAYPVPNDVHRKEYEADSLGSSLFQWLLAYPQERERLSLDIHEDFIPLFYLKIQDNKAARKAHAEYPIDRFDALSRSRTTPLQGQNNLIGFLHCLAYIEDEM